MLTPDKIKEKSFQTTGRGSYRSDDVDSFLSEVSASYEQMFKENTDLIKKISILAKKVEEYRADEESLKMALFNAQKLADRIVAEAKETAANEVASVKDETDTLRADAARDAAALEENAKNESEAMLATAKRESDALVASAKAEAEKLLKDATAEAKEILGNINRKVTHESLVYEMVQKEASEFKSKLVAMYKDHINLINQLPEIVDEQLDEEEKATVVEEAVVEEAPAPVVEETPVEIVEAVEDDFVVVEPEEEAVVIDDEPVVEDVVEPVVEETPVAPKKSFKIDLSKIDFADDDEGDAPAPSLFDNFEIVDDEEDDDAQSMSFKNFFKKK